MKNFIRLFFCLIVLPSFGQSPIVEFDSKNWEAPYTLNFPEGWYVERFLIPIGFAPEIPYQGVEDIRFAPGWSKVKSDGYWTYAFLWYLNDRPKTNAKIVEKNLNAYYTGLIAGRINSGKIPPDQSVSVKTAFNKVKTDKGDLKTFRGTIYMLDYMDQKPITLNCIVHLKTCSGQNKTFIFFELSPKPYSDDIWQSLNQLWTDFRCGKAEESK